MEIVPRVWPRAAPLDPIDRGEHRALRREGRRSRAARSGSPVEHHEIPEALEVLAARAARGALRLHLGERGLEALIYVSRVGGSRRRLAPRLLRRVEGFDALQREDPRHLRIEVRGHCPPRADELLPVGDQELVARPESVPVRILRREGLGDTGMLRVSSAESLPSRFRSAAENTATACESVPACGSPERVPRPATKTIPLATRTNMVWIDRSVDCRVRQSEGHARQLRIDRNHLSH
jgi:hypothetical protein